MNTISLPDNAICISGIPSSGKTLLVHAYLSKLAELEVNDNKIIPYINARGHLINITESNNSLNSLYKLDFQRNSETPIKDLVDLKNYANTLVIGAPVSEVNGSLCTGYLSRASKQILLLAKEKLAFNYILYAKDA